MPRIFMAVATEDRHPITDIMRQTPDIPANCQWAVFLRNHDELTLEMVTDRERDYLWNYYATDKRMRLNLGIRRRLAPLMENDRRRIELLSGLMFAMPGTPVMYYGDEIGMGDNIFLGDRDGVRTPMQWSPDRNAGFSRANPAQLYLPPIMDAVYGYQAVNVEAQLRLPSSQLNWTKRLIAVRKARRAFGRGDLRFLYPSNRKVLAFLRSLPDETILCVFNLSRAPQPVELDLKRFAGRTPLELGGRTTFPVIGEQPYMLTLPGHGFLWFLLEPAPASEPAWRAPATPPDLITLVMPGGWASLLGHHNRPLLEQEVLPAFLPAQRWFGAAERSVGPMTVLAAAEIGTAFYTVIAAAGGGGGRELYNLPLAVCWEAPEGEAFLPLAPYTLARARRARAEGVIIDATADPRFALTLVAAMRDGQAVAAGEGGFRLVFRRTTAFDSRSLPDPPSVRHVGAERANATLLIEDYAVVKLYRRPVAGIHPEIEMTRFLTEVAAFPHTPPLMGHFAIERDDETVPLGAMFAHVRNQDDAWSQALNYLGRYLDEGLMMAPQETRPPEPGATVVQSSHPLYLELAGRLGRRTAELHRALCPSDAPDPAFAPEPVTREDLARWKGRAQETARLTLAALAVERAELPLPAREAGERLLARRDALLRQLDVLLPAELAAMKTRLHGDYHLGQVLVVQNDYAIIDFEGGVTRAPAERRAKGSPLEDVASMLWSYGYAAATEVRRMAELQPAAASILNERAAAWRRQVTATFLDRYRSAIAGVPSHPEAAATADRLIAFFLLERALEEIRTELANRPAWVDVPIGAVLAMTEDAENALAGT
jgi:maltose alpha-D-glucosyltransferase/alpha-amylase